jgi:hypothetical protein
MVEVNYSSNVVTVLLHKPLCVLSMIEGIRPLSRQIEQTVRHIASLRIS